MEDAMGPGRYLVFYLLGGLVAMLARVAADPHSTVPNLGASGAIAAVMGAFLVTSLGSSLPAETERKLHLACAVEAIAGSKIR